MEFCYCWGQLFSLTVMLIFVLGQEISSEALMLDFRTDPPGPTFPAATWIRLACKAKGGLLSDFTYQWRGLCSQSGDVVFTINDALIDREGSAVVWVHSTPTECLDIWECSANDKEGNNRTDTFQVTDIAGAGLSINIPLQNIENNSAIILSGDVGVTPLNVYCHSALSNSWDGGWFLPGGEKVASERLTGDVSYYWTLSLGATVEEGLYRCVVSGVQDEGVAHVSTIGVYWSSYELASFEMVDMMFRETTASSLELGCTTVGLPATASVWSSNGVLINLNGSNISYIAGQTLMDSASALYTTTLLIQHQLRRDIQGTFVCEVYSSWMASDQSITGKERVAGQFAFLPLGEEASVQCVLPDDATDVEWYEGENLILGASEDNVTALDVTVLDTLHLALYTCQGRDQDRSYYFYTKIIVQVPDLLLSVEVTDTSDPSALTCCASKLVKGLSNTPVITWYDPNGKAVNTTGSLKVSERQICLTLFVDNKNEYTCVVELDSPALTQPLVESVKFSEGEIPPSSSQTVSLSVIAAVATVVSMVALVTGSLLVLLIAVQIYKHKATKIDDVKQ